MGPIEFSILLLAIFTVYTSFCKRTTQMALHARERMAFAVRDILNDDNASKELKRTAVCAFAASANSSFIPFILRRVLFSRKKSKTKKIKLKEEHEKVLNNLMREHFFRVNVLASPHWYALFASIFFLLVLVISVIRTGQGGYKLLSSLEKSIIYPAFNDNSVRVKA